MSLPTEKDKRKLAIVVFNQPCRVGVTAARSASISSSVIEVNPVSPDSDGLCQKIVAGNFTHILIERSMSSELIQRIDDLDSLGLTLLGRIKLPVAYYLGENDEGIVKFCGDQWLWKDVIKIISYNHGFPVVQCVVWLNEQIASTQSIQEILCAKVREQTERIQNWQRLLDELGPSPFPSESDVFCRDNE